MFRVCFAVFAWSLIAFGVAAAHAQTAWRPVLSDPNLVVFLDQARTEKSAGVVTAWSMFAYAKPTPSPFGIMGRLESREQFDCGQKMHQTLLIDFYSTSGVLLHHQSRPGPKEPVPADKVGDYMMQAACDGTFASGDTFADTSSAVAFGRSWALSYANPAPVVARSTDTMKQFPPPPALTDLTLPEGRLAAVGGQAEQRFAFLDLDRTHRTETQALGTAYWVYAPHSVPDNPSVTQSVERIQFNCTADTYVLLGSLAFDDKDVLVIWLPRSVEAQALVPGSTTAALAKLACGDEGPPAETITIGHAAALALANKALSVSP